MPHRPGDSPAQPDLDATTASPVSRGVNRALWANAAAILLLAVALVANGRPGDTPATPAADWPSMLPAAFGQNGPNIAGGGGIYIMPAQLANTIWGTYVVDIDSQTLMVYQFDASGKSLNFLAARDISNDRRLGNYNTVPDPLEIKDIADKELQKRRLDAE